MLHAYHMGCYAALPALATVADAAVARGRTALLLAVELTSLARKHLPRKWWRRIHGASFPLFVVSSVHLFTAGTDSAQPVIIWSTAVAWAVIAAMTTWRILQSRPRDRLDLDLHLPRSVEQRLHHDRGVRRTDVVEDLAVHRSDGAEVGRVDQVHAGPYHVGE